MTTVAAGIGMRSGAGPGGVRVALGWTLGIALLVAAVVATAQLSTRLAVPGAGFVLFLVSLAEPRAGIALVATAIVLSPEIPVGGVAGTRLEDGLIALVGGAWLMRRVVGLESAEGMPLTAALVAYVGVGVVGTLWGELLGTARALSLDTSYGALPHMLKRVELALLCVITAHSLRTSRDVIWMTYLLVAVLVVFCVYTWSHFQDTGFSGEAPPGAAGHEAGLGGVILLALCLGLMSHTRGWRTAFLFLPLLAAVVTIPLSLGRNFTLTASILLTVFAISKKRWFLLILPLLFWFGVQWLPPHVADRLATLRWLFADDPTGAATQGASLLSRLQPPLFFGQLALFNSPIFGFGLASVPLGFIDSEYVTQMYFTGLLGVVVFVWLLRMVVKTFRDAAGSDGAGRTFRTCFGFVLGAYAVYSLFSPSISAARAGAMFFLLVGMLVAAVRPSKEGWRREQTGDR